MKFATARWGGVPYASRRKDGVDRNDAENAELRGGKKDIEAQDG